MVRQLYLWLYLFYQAKIFSDYKTRRPVPSEGFSLFLPTVKYFVLSLSLIVDNFAWFSCFRVIFSCFFRLDRY